MILIYSISTDATTNLVIDWLRFFNTDWIRINLIDFGKRTDFTINLSDKTKITKLEDERVKIDLTKKMAVWLRRYAHSSRTINQDNIDINIINQIKDNVYLEKKSVWEILNRNICKKEKWLNHFESVKLSKPKQLESAAKLNIKIPETIVTTSKMDLLNFFRKHKKIIIKPIETFGSYVIDGYSLTPFTQLVDEKFINDLNESFLPILCQIYIEKEFEIRSFYLDKIFYSTAMFTQRNKSTRIDSRNLDDKNPVRNVPYKMNIRLEADLRKFMKMHNLNSGSLDLIMGKDGKIYFLEVNPVGQFGFSSFHCNYNLEKKIAEYLIKLKNEN